MARCPRLVCHLAWRIMVIAAEVAAGIYDDDKLELERDDRHWLDGLYADKYSNSFGGGGDGGGL